MGARLAALVGAGVIAACSGASDREAHPAPSTKRWSLGSYPGWVQQYDMHPGEVDYSPFTHILHFAMYPTRRGGLRIGDLISRENARRAVASAHAHGRKIVLVVGGEGIDQFVSATRGERRDRLVRNIVTAIDRYDYDGVSVDWEEKVVPRRLVALVSELRAALDKRDPRSLLLLDVISGLVPPRTAARVADLVDSINVFSYYRDRGSRIERQFALYRNAGVPASKLVAGIGIFPRGYDRNVRRVARKLAFVRAHGLRGVELWSFEWARWSDPRIGLIREFAARR
ncbi:MAG: glycoside hydrolase family 18 protein [Thermoleophilaceae bacterium]